MQYYLCLGTHCNCAFDPPDADLAADGHGIGAAVDRLRNISGHSPSPPPWGPPPPQPGGEKCAVIREFNCSQGKYCTDEHSGQMTDFAQ